MRRKVWETVGKFDEGFKGAFYEDNDMHLRMHRAGISACCIDVPFYHVGSATIKLLEPDEQRLLHSQSELNSKYFEQKWGIKSGSEAYYEAFKNPQDQNALEHGTACITIPN
jgi:GT2 family glycosyltransferase